MKCPKCHSQMENVRFDDVEVDRCTNCKGLWFDMLEQEDLKKLKGSEQIDIGDAEVGQKLNKAEATECPACGQRMIGMVDKDHPSISFESCSHCYGVFFDAGEFKEYKEESVFSSLRGLYAKTRD